MINKIDTLVDVYLLIFHGLNYRLMFFLQFIYQALQDARMKTTETLVAMEKGDDFDNPVTPTPVRGGNDNESHIIFIDPLKLALPCSCPIIFQH